MPSRTCIAASANRPASVVTAPPVERVLIRVIWMIESTRKPALIRKTHLAPYSARTGPATGPITREPNCIIEASVIALSNAAAFTVLGSSAACAGISAERSTPEQAVTSTRFQKEMVPVNANAASTSAQMATPAREIISTRARS